jgi:hypothetical protein
MRIKRRHKQKAPDFHPGLGISVCVSAYSSLDRKPKICSRLTKIDTKLP